MVFHSRMINHHIILNELNEYEGPADGSGFSQVV
jgi:hypothetical protein